MDCTTFTNSGQLGDTVGGWANVVTAVLTLIGLCFAFFQVNAWKKQHAHTTRAAAAKEMWLAAFRFLTTLRAVRNPAHGNVGEDSAQHVSIADGFLRRSADRRADVDRSADQYLDAWAVAELVFDKPTLSVLDEVWAERGRLSGDIARWTAEVDVLGEDSGASYDLLFGADARNRLDAVQAKLKQTLRSLAVTD